MKLGPQLHNSRIRPDTLLLLATAVFLICAVCIPVWPGFMSYDSIDALKRARHGIPDNIYPPLTAYVQYIFDLILPGGGLLFAYQVSLYLLSCAAVLICARVPLWLGIPALTFLTFTPATFGPLLVVWKDIMIMAVLMSCTFLYQMIDARCKTNSSETSPTSLKRQYFLPIAFLSFLFFASAYRHNSLSAVLPFVLFGAHRFFAGDIRKVMLSSIAIVAIFVSAIFLFNSYRLPDLKPIKGYLITQFQVADIIGVSTFSGKNLLPAQFTRKYAQYSVEDLRNAYCPDHINRSCRKSAVNQKPLDFEVLTAIRDYGLWTDGSGDFLDSNKITKAWWQAVTQNSQAYLHHRFVFALEFLGIGKRTPNFLYYTKIEPNEFGLEFKPNGLTKYTLNYLQYSSTWIIAFPWFYYAIGLVISVLLCFIRPPNWKIPALLISSAFSTFVPLVIFSPTAEQRYHEWSMAAISMATILYVNALIQSKRMSSNTPT